MHVTVWLAFCAAYLVMAITPGPVTLLVTSYALSLGRRTALAVVAGTTLGDTTCLLAAVLGLGAILAASATAFLVLKLAGAGYLLFLGWRLWRAPVSPPGEPDEDAAPPGGLRWGRMFLHAYITTTLNPKTVLFFMVFVPQFIDPAAPLAPQVSMLVPTVLVLGAMVDGGYAMAAASLRRFTRATRTRRAINRVCGGVLMSEGVAAALGRTLLA